MNKTDRNKSSNTRRWVWFAGLYAASVLALAAVAYGMRWLLSG
jgi:hypothetical protein